MTGAVARALRRPLLLLAAVVAVLGLLPAAPAAAHAALESSTPAANAVLTSSPPLIALDFDERIEAGVATIRLFDGDGVAIDIGSPESGADDSQVQATVPRLDDGLYAVVWHVVSADGHPVDGAFAFQIGTTATGDAEALLEQVRTVGSSARASWWSGVARFASFAGFVLVAGGGWWALRRPARLVEHRRIRTVLSAGAALLVVGALGAFAVFSAQVGDGSFGAAWSPSSWVDALDTQPGRMLLVRLLAAVALLGLALPPVRRTGSLGPSAPVVAGLLLAALVSFPMAGHPNALSPQVLWIAVDAVHLAAISVWLGGVLVLALCPSSVVNEPEVQRIARGFSAAATVAIPVAIVTGVAHAWRLAGGLGHVADTSWGTLLIVKVGVVVVVLALAAAARRRLHRGGAAAVRRVVRTELVAGVVILALTAALAGEPPRTPLPSRPYDETLAGSGVIASVSISPGRVGSNEMHVLLTPPGGSITPIAGLAVRVSLPSAGIPPAPGTVVPEGPNHFSGTVTFTEAGEWTVEFIVQVTDTEAALLKATVSIP